MQAFFIENLGFWALQSFIPSVFCKYSLKKKKIKEKNDRKASFEVDNSAMGNQPTLLRKSFVRRITIRGRP